MSDSASTPCITCGACCAHFRASFHWSESDPSLGGTVPAELTEKISAHRVAMKGTNCSTPRCASLQGEIGSLVHCNIYPQRSSTCREFSFSWENNEPHDRCDQARAAHGLAPLQPPVIAIISQPETERVTINKTLLPPIAQVLTIDENTLALPTP